MLHEGLSPVETQEQEERRVGELLAKSFNFSRGDSIVQVWYLVWKEQQGEPILHITTQDIGRCEIIRKILLDGYLAQANGTRHKLSKKEVITAQLLRECGKALNSAMNVHANFDISQIDADEVERLAKNISNRQDYRRKI